MKNLVGQKFGKLEVLKCMGKDKWGHFKWQCLCDCGGETIVVGSALRGNHTRSCGCLKREKTIQRSTKHGHAKQGRITKTYRTWCNMLTRCYNPNHDRYKCYGGRGIKVCKRWMTFSNFLEDMGNPPTKKIFN